MLRGLRINICISNPMLWQHRHLNLWSPDGRAAVVPRRHRLAQGEEEEGERLHCPQVGLEGTVGGHHMSWHLPLRLWPWLMCFFSVMKRWRMTRSVWTELWGTTWGWVLKKSTKNFNWTSIKGEARGHCGNPELPRREVWQEGPCLAHRRQCGGSHRWNYSPWEISGSLNFNVSRELVWGVLEALLPWGVQADPQGGQLHHQRRDEGCGVQGEALLDGNHINYYW